MDIYKPYTQVDEKPRNGKFSPRPEQEDAITKAFKYFSKNKEKCAEFLWNAKMRFGKTVCALWLIERLYKELGLKRVLIVTHRPVVNASWYGDFKNLFKDDLAHYSYGTARETDDENKFKDFYGIKADAEQNGKCVIFFASMQYLRLAKVIRGLGEDNSKVKQDILNYDWDLVIIDEAHEGTQTELGAGVINYLKQSNPFVLYLSGTPFNLLDEFKGDQIYNWDYIKEQHTKRKWDETHKHQDSLFDAEKENPYRALPEMSLMRYQISDMTDEQAIKDAATGKFSFTEFFRVKTGHDVPKEERGKFLHENEVLQFLMTMWKPGTDYPFSKDEYRKFFRHTLWVVPGVKEAEALKVLIETKTPLAQWGFKVVNVAGDQELKENALDKVFKAMKVDPKTGADDSDQTYTITISCGRLTTGVTVKPWTAVLYMKGSETTSASTYMQTIFRVQSPHVLHGMMKSQCYVFDFAPERALIMMAETAKYSRAFEKKESKKEKKQKSVIDQEDKDKMRQLIDTFHVYDTDDKGCPLIVNGEMKPIEPERLFAQLTSVYVDKVVRNGFDHPSLYNYNEFLKLELEDEMNLNYISGIFDDSSSDNKGGQDNKVEVNHQDYTPEQLAALAAEKAEREAAAKKAREEAKKKYADKLAKMSEEEREKFLKEKEVNAKKLKLIHQSKDKLTGLSKRIPLMMYGANVNDFEEVTIDNFTDKRFIDDDSWNEFMPNGVTRQLFRKLTKFYNPDVFKEAGIRIRHLAREADGMKVEERIARIAQIFKWFKNPDKETVLTPWEVINRHMSSTLGGYCFFEDDFKTPVVKIDKETGEILDTNEPRFVHQGEVTKEVFGDGTLGNIDELQGKINTKILEINSKTGLYPLYVAYSLYRHLLPVYANEKGLMADNPDDYSADDEHAIWDEVVSNNLYVICNTKMAERITRRTLLGFRTGKDGEDIKLHVKQDNLVCRVRNNKDTLIRDLQNEKYWENSKMKDKKITFSAVVGNPPYQITNKGIGNGSDPVYHLFINIARAVSEKVTLIHPARFLFNAGKTPKEWNEAILNDEHARIVDYSANSKDFFDNVTIEGGLVITYFDKKAKFNKIGKFIAYSQLRSIISKVTDRNDFCSFKDLVYTRDLYRLTNTLYEENPWATSRPSKGHQFDVGSNVFDVFPELFFDSIPDDDNKYIKIFGRDGNVRGNKYIKSTYVQTPDNFNYYKVFIAKADGAAGQIGKPIPARILGKTAIGKPVEGSTATFLSIGKFHDEKEAMAVQKYIATQFVRTLVATLKATQNNTRDVWENVPLQDFTLSSDIDWTQSIENINKQLYIKYKLGKEEIEFIETMIQPMC